MPTVNIPFHISDSLAQDATFSIHPCLDHRPIFTMRMSVVSFAVLLSTVCLVSGNPVIPRFSGILSPSDVEELKSLGFYREGHGPKSTSLPVNAVRKTPY